MARINVFLNHPTIHQAEATFVPQETAKVEINAFVLDGSISFNTVAFLYSKAGTTARSLTISFGLYSMNGATLSLANSASVSTNPPSGNLFSWISLATSAQQDLTPGVWYFAHLVSSSSANFSLMGRSFGGALTLAPIGGPLFRGRHSVTTNALPSSIATSDCIVEGGNNAGNPIQTRSPFILISA